jgi:histidyl-tRNA synthetase
MLQKPRGTRDFLPDEMEHRRAIEQRMRGVANLWGYREVCTPTFEHLELFTMRSGEGIIKEMYAFQDKGGRDLVLRPEVTASVLRMYVNEAKVMPKPLRWSYFADCYRYERPQKGRYRQFWQFGVELIGADTPAADAEVILMGQEVLSGAGVSFDMHVGHLEPMKYLLAGLEATDQKMVMGYLDKRDFQGLEECLAAIGNEGLQDSLTGLVETKDLHEVFEITGEIPQKARIEETFDILDTGDMPYVPNFGIVRGLDYYTGTVFEAFAPNLGAENQILGGGAYRLAHLFGGDDIGQCGFAIGFDRVMVSLGETPPVRPVVVGIVYTPEAKRTAFEVASQFREAGVQAELNLTARGIGAQMKHVAKSADYAVVLGTRECERGTVTLKNLSSGTQSEYGREEAIAEVTRSGAR